MSYDDRKYKIIKAESAVVLDFECLKINDVTTARESIDQTELLISYESAPACLDNLSWSSDEYSHESALVIMNDPDWRN